MREGWKEVKLGEIINIKHGYGFKGEFFSDEETENILLTPGNFNIGGGFKADKLKYYAGPINENFILNENDVIVTMTDLSKMADTLGFSAKIPRDSSKKYLHNQRIGLVELINNTFDLDFIYWLLRTESYQRYIAGSAIGATVKHTSPNKIYTAKVQVPESKETQRKIAKILSNYDELIENNLKRIKILEEMAQQTYEEWFVRMRFPGYETTKINETTGLPEGWERDLVGNQLDKIKSTTKIKSSEIQKSGLFPVIDQSRDFIAGFTDDRVAVLRYSNTPYIVFGDHTRVLKLINFDFARGADGTQIIKSKNKRMPQHLFYFTLMNIDLSNYHYARHFKYLKDSEIIIPSESIANTFEDLVKLNYDIIFNLQSQNQRLREARDILLPRLMMGLVDVEDIDL